MGNLIKDSIKLGFGMMRLPRVKEDGRDVIDVEQTKDMVDAFLQAGGKYIDTAFVYEGSEEATRKALVERYPRNAYYLATKLNASEHAAKNEEEAKQEFRTSLERTGAGYFDFYLLHALGRGNVEKYDQYGLWDYVKGLKAEGLIRHWGFSFHDTADFLDELLTEHPDAEFRKARKTGRRHGTGQGRYSGGSALECPDYFRGSGQKRIACVLGNPFCSFSAECHGRPVGHVEHGADGGQPVLHEGFQAAR